MKYIDLSARMIRDKILIAIDNKLHTVLPVVNVKVGRITGTRLLILYIAVKDGVFKEYD